MLLREVFAFRQGDTAICQEQSFSSYKPIDRGIVAPDGLDHCQIEWIHFPNDWPGGSEDVIQQAPRLPEVRANLRERIPPDLFQLPCELLRILLRPEPILLRQALFQSGLETSAKHVRVRC